MELQLAIGNFDEPNVKFVDVQNDESLKVFFGRWKNPSQTDFISGGLFTYRIHVWYTYLLTNFPLKQIKQSWYHDR